MIHYSITFRSFYANRSVVGVLMKAGDVNGVNSAVYGSANVQYLRYNTYGQWSTVSSTFTVDLSANQSIWLETVLLNGSGPFQVTAVGGAPSTLTITRIA